MGEVTDDNPGTFPSADTGMKAFSATWDEGGGGQYASHLPLTARIGVCGRFRVGNGPGMPSSSGVEPLRKLCCRLVHNFPTQVNR
ncbi:hypothetical protein RRF57_012392 [Xylaria bambusicola]|uniref:Uncharacterized protein n=1 Tax=Xylaria bambusicola TaxID=326684 RepID=A0AAN7Z4H2_9PEZI